MGLSKDCIHVKYLPEMGEAAVPSTIYSALCDTCQYWSSDVYADSLPLQSSCPEDPTVHVLLVYH